MLDVDRQLVRIGRPARRSSGRSGRRSARSSCRRGRCSSCAVTCATTARSGSCTATRRRRAAVPRQPGRPAAPGRVLRLGLAAGARRRRTRPRTPTCSTAAPLVRQSRCSPPGHRSPAVAGHLGDVPETVMRTYAHWLRDDRSLPAAMLDRMLAPTVDGGSTMSDRPSLRPDCDRTAAARGGRREATAATALTVAPSTEARAELVKAGNTDAIGTQLLEPVSRIEDGRFAGGLTTNCEPSATRNHRSTGPTAEPIVTRS